MMALTSNGQRLSERLDPVLLQIAAIQRARLEFAQALEELKASDPAGWEAWYDDDANIPPVIHWGDPEQVAAILVAIRAHIATITQNEAAA